MGAHHGGEYRIHSEDDFGKQPTIGTTCRDVASPAFIRNLLAPQTPVPREGLRSPHIPHPKVIYRIYNTTYRPADLIWITFDGSGQNYCSIPPKRYLDTSTYPGHIWIAREGSTGQRLHFRYRVKKGPPINEEIFKVPKPNTDPQHITHCCIVSCFRNLSQRATEKVARLVTEVSKVDELPLTAIAKRSVKQYLHLKEEYEQNLNIAENITSNMPEVKSAVQKRKRPKKRATLVGQLLALPPTQVVIKPEHVSEALESSDVTTFNKLFEIAVQARQVDTVLGVVLKICSESDKEVPLTFDALSQFSQHFVTLGSGTASESLEALLKILKDGKSDRVVAYLVNRLISSVDILRNGKFRQSIKERLPGVINGQKYSCFLAESLCYTLLMEVSYQDSVDIFSLSRIWAPVAEAGGDPVTALLTLILHCCSVSVKKDEEVFDDFCTSLQKFKSTSYEPYYTDMFLRILEQHLSSISHVLSLSGLQNFAQFLVEHHLSSGDLAFFMNSLHCRGDLSPEFYDCLYTELFKCLAQECSSFDSEISESIGKIKCSSKSSALAKAVKRCLTAAPTSKWVPSQKGIDLIEALCCSDVVELYPHQRFVVIFIASLMVSGEVFDRTISALNEILEAESIKTKLSNSVLKRIDDNGVSVKTLHKAWLKKDGMRSESAQHLARLLAWISLSLFGEKSVNALLKIASKTSSTSNITLAAAVEVFCQLEEFNDSLVDTITQLLDSIFEENTWSTLKVKDDLVEVERSVFVLQPLQRFCRIVHKQKKNFVSLSNSATCIKMAKNICRGKLNGSSVSSENASLYKRIVQHAADFLLFAGYVMNWGKTVIDWEYLVALARVDVEFSRKVFLRATNDEVAGLLSSLSQLDVGSTDINLVLTIGRFITERKSVSSLMVAHLEPFIMLMMRPECDMRNKLQFAGAIIPLLSGSPIEEDFVNLVLGMVGVIEWREIADETRLYLVGEVSSLMIAVIRSSVGSERFSVVGAIIGKLINLTHSLKKSSEKSEVLQTEHERLEHTVASMCHTIVGFKDKFARIAPFVVSECLANDREAALSMHRLLGACDKFSIALLSSTLPTAKKRCFAHVYPQFANVNKIVV
ncbi:hypothetical protein QR680_017669 [Steinernema hermaphroditum]|uniref:von Hippel-Lindau disease tumour suppressor beta domain-containing protein n=1 Tax=Steinernema hermaphroditum TaxID=289476 RepID=A0AA39HGL6_9BILA|nr:hypothetical protein QR680_017669 [Steinernema hermaphroditum]